MVVVRAVHVVDAAIFHDTTAVRCNDPHLPPVATLQGRAQHETKRRQEEEQTDDVGHESGHHEQKACEQEAHPVEDLVRGHVARRHLLLHPAQHTKTLALHQHRAEGRDEKQKGDRGKHPEPRPDLDERIDLRERECDEDQEENGHHLAG